jgi:uncharacterized membrane protein
MVPPAMPNPGLLVTITGLLELAGAVGLLLPPTAPWAAGGLTALLVGLFPANVYAALNGITTSPEDALVPRTLMQLVFLAATVAVLASYLRGRRLRRRSAIAPDGAQGWQNQAGVPRLRHRAQPRLADRRAGSKGPAGT